MSQKLINFCCDLIADVTKDGKPFLFASLGLTRIGEAPMDLLSSIGEVWAGFSSFITDGHDQIHCWLVAKRVQTLRPMRTEIEPDLAHGLDRQWMHHAWFRACAEDFVGNTASCSQQPLCHLGAGGVVGTQKEHAPGLRDRFGLSHEIPPSPYENV